LLKILPEKFPLKPVSVDHPNLVYITRTPTTVTPGDWMEGGMIGDLGYVIGILDYRAGPGSVIILCLLMMDFLALVD
jgi:hypothetical protein